MATKAIVTPIADYDRDTLIADLTSGKIKAADRVKTLTALPLGEIAAISAIAGVVVDSAYEALNLKMIAKHGNDWVKRLDTKAETDLEKDAKKAISADIEAIRETIRSKRGDAPSRKAVLAVKEWGKGKRKAKGANSTKARPTVDWLLAKETLPAMYRRLNKAEDIDGTEQSLMDAIGDYLRAKGIDPRKVLED